MYRLLAGASGLVYIIGLYIFVSIIILIIIALFFLGFSVLDFLTKPQLLVLCLMSILLNIYLFNCKKDKEKDVLYLKIILKDEAIQTPLTKEHIQKIALKWARYIRERNSKKIDNAGKEYRIYTDICARLNKIMYQDK